jgi:hypothetical protein
MTSITLIAALMATGCAFDENLPEVDLSGVVRLPAAITQFNYQEDPTLDADPTVIDDVRGIGPVYLGVFPSVQEGLYDYPHPEIGPVLTAAQEGNTYPYGGTSIGRFDWACYQQLKCKIVTGRFTSYDDIIDYFANKLNTPIEDQLGNEVLGGTDFQERCFEVLYMTGDYELLFADTETDFNLDSSGEYYEAEIEIPHVIYAEGMSVWGWVDMPSQTYEFSSCDPDVGEVQNYYNDSYDIGTNSIDLLNYPGNYIDSGDWVVQEAAIINNPADQFELEIGFHYVDE